MAAGSGSSYETILDRYNQYVPDAPPELLNTIDSRKKDFCIYRMTDVSDRADYNMREMKEIVSGALAGN